MGTFERSNYPKFDGAFCDKPVEESCPKCSMPFIIEKITKKDGTIRYCKNEDCDYKMAVSNTDVTADAAESKVPAA